MPFENFYEESDQADRRWRRLLFCSIIFLPVVYLTVPFLYSWSENYKPEIDEEQATRERHVDALCIGLPKPEQFDFVGREPFLSSANTSSIILRYRSEREFEEIMPTFRVWFDANGWTADANWKSTFNKGAQSILIQNSEDYPEIFDIRCYERAPDSLSFEIYD